MGATVAARARRAPVVARPAPPRRPPLRVVEPSRPGRRHRGSRRYVALAVGIVVVSLLAVAAAQAYLTAGQVRLARLQGQLTVQQSRDRDLELRVASMEDPADVVGQAERQGLTVPARVTDLPLVSPSASAGSGAK